MDGKDTLELRQKYASAFHAFDHACMMAMVEADAEKGDSWRAQSLRINKHTTTSMRRFLMGKLQQALQEYVEYERPKKLIQIRNYAAMLWTRLNERIDE